MKISKEFLYLNLGVLLISTSGIFGRLVTLQPELVIFYRCLVAAFLLFGVIKWFKEGIKVKSKDHYKYILIGGVMMAVHWVTYFYSLSLSSIAIAMLTLHTFPAMTSILEPLILKTPFKAFHLLLALLVVLGVWVILPSADFGDKIVLATAMGLVSALAYALRNIFTKKVITHYHGSVMMYYQMVIMAVILTPFLGMYDSGPLTKDWPYIVALALFTTVIGHTLLVQSLKHFSAVSVSLISSIIPLYGILSGLIFLNEKPSINTLLGGTLIMASFIVESIASQRKKVRT